MIKQLKKPIKKAITNFRTLVLTRHPSHSILRSKLALLPFRSLIRLGSETIPTDGKQRVELNSVQAVRNSANKLRMKQCFTKGNVQHAQWWNSPNEIPKDVKYPIIAKSLTGSRGRGNTKLDSVAELDQFIRSHENMSNYIFEKFYTYSKEYRLHITNDGCFYTCRKLLKTENSEDWQRHDNNCIWILENNPKFMKPANWNLIVEDCIRAKNALGLDICAFDVMVQGSGKEAPKWIICELCSALSFGDITAQKYLIEIPKLLKKKYNNR